MIRGGTLLALLAAVMLLVGAGAYWLWKHGGALECVDRVIEEVPSPDGSVIAARWERACGGAVATHVSLRAGGSPFATDELDEVYVAKARPRVAMHWEDAASLAIDASERSISSERRRWRNITVRWRR